MNQRLLGAGELPIALKVTSAAAEKQALQRICCFAFKHKWCPAWDSIRITGSLLSRFQNHLVGRDSRVVCI